MIADRLYRASVVFLAVVALFFVLDVAEEVFAPLTLALVLGLVLSPLSSLLRRLRVPDAVNALVSLATALAVLFVIGLLLEPSISRIAERAPLIWTELRLALADAQQILSGIDRLQDDVADALGRTPQDRGAGGGGGPEIPSMTDALLLAPSIAAQVLIFIGTLFFFLLTREEIYLWLARMTPLSRAQLREVERVVSRYFLTITVINAGFGVCVAIGLALIGLPSPVLWGVIAAGANFVLYLGPAVVALSLAVTGVIVFDGPAVLLPPAVFVGLNLAEGQFVTPALVGRRMAVNPLLVFVSLVFMLWLWGPTGGIIAIPVLICALALDTRLRAAWGRRPPPPPEQPF